MAHDESDRGEPKSTFWNKVNQVGPAWLAAIAGAVVAVVAVITLLAAGTFTSTSNAPPTSKGSLSIQDSYLGGVWTRSQPEAGPLPGEHNRPANGVEWIPNERVVKPLCAQAADPYPVKLNGKSETWHWWAKLPGQGWVPMAAFQETTVDGPYNLPAC